MAFTSSLDSSYPTFVAMGLKSVLAFLLILIGAKAAEYFVSLEGDDDNSGTPSPETLAARQASS